MYTDQTTTVQQTSSTRAQQTSQQTPTTSIATTIINIGSYNFFLIMFAYLYNLILFVAESSTNALSTFIPDIITTSVLQEKGL